ncbi:hypothetical protein N657DRAFT_685088 [Parathielavia appendiculata]|uniref:Uncharacterized protein n=1 Tax=Parathielavia appendiculata TaxID=2587402 RepID=A0AAN6TR69_9PEZI|nr:hypothetical protein N657DRAFT_685088 [Parathielavia appendiculata]
MASVWGLGRLGKRNSRRVKISKKGNPTSRPFFTRIYGIATALAVTLALLGVIIFLKKTLPNGSTSSFALPPTPTLQAREDEGRSDGGLDARAVLTVGERPPLEPVATINFPIDKLLDELLCCDAHAAADIVVHNRNIYLNDDIIILVLFEHYLHHDSSPHDSHYTKFGLKNHPPRYFQARKHKHMSRKHGVLHDEPDHCPRRKESRAGLLQHLFSQTRGVLDNIDDANDDDYSSICLSGHQPDYSKHLSHFDFDNHDGIQRNICVDNLKFPSLEPPSQFYQYIHHDFNNLYTPIILHNDIRLVIPIILVATNPVTIINCANLTNDLFRILNPAIHGPIAFYPIIHSFFELAIHNLIVHRPVILGILVLAAHDLIAFNLTIIIIRDLVIPATSDFVTVCIISVITFVVFPVDGVVFILFRPKHALNVGSRDFIGFRNHLESASTVDCLCDGLCFRGVEWDV